MRIALLATAVLLAVPTHPAASDDVVRIHVTFDVANTNASALICRTDEGRYRIEGHVVGPASLLRKKSVPVGTLYLHEFSFGSFFWNFDDVPGYDFVGDMAKRGHVSVIVDRLGYDASGRPAGTGTCLGAHADMTQQIVQQLKSGTRTPAFEKLVLAGHSVGGSIAELAAHSFKDQLDLAGLIVFAWADQGYSQRAIQQSVQQAADCFPTGEESEPGGPKGYAYFGRTEADFQANVFNDADPTVVERVTARRNRDPCGDNATLVRVAAVNTVGVRSVTVPVLLVFGDEDAVFDDTAAEDQAALFAGSSDVTLRRIPGAGHALTLQRSAPQVRDIVSDWLPSAQATATSPAATVQDDARVEAVDEPAATLPATGSGAPALTALGLLLLLLGTFFHHTGGKACPKRGS